MARPRSAIRARLLIAARRLFLGQGVEGASLRGIAALARTNLGMVYYYFKTKDDLFFAAVDDVYERFLADVAKALDEGEPVAARIDALFRRVAALTEEELMVVRIVLSEFLSSTPRVNRLIERFQRGHIALLMDLVSQGVDSGVLRRDLPPPFLVIALGALAFPAQVITRLAHERLPFPLPAGGVPESLARILLTGIGAPPSSTDTGNRAG